jgi:putative SOS response-associated peptidase YedK
MCGRYAATLPPEMMVELFNLLKSVDMPPRYNIKPTDPILAVRNSRSQGGRVAEMYRWGLVPAWVKDLKDFPVLINARADSMTEKPAFRTAMKFYRCVIPADGYFEWMAGPDGKKHPYFITLKANEPMVFAGLYSVWRAPDGEKMPSATIVTVTPNLDISGIHDRMPAILTGEAIDQWLNTEEVSPEEAAKLAVAPPLGAMRYHIVSKEVGKVEAEGPHLVRPLTLEEAEAEGGSGRPAARKKAAGGSGQMDLF